MPSSPSSFAHQFYKCSLSSSADNNNNDNSNNISSFNIPFCVQPYSVQQHLAASIRVAAGEKKKVFANTGNDNNDDDQIRTSSSNNTTHHTVAVLESPTGTGKSQALLCGVLSHIAEERYIKIKEKRNNNIKSNHEDAASHQNNIDADDVEELFVPSSLVSRVNTHWQKEKQTDKQTHEAVRRQRQDGEDGVNQHHRKIQEDDDANEVEDDRDQAANELLNRVNKLIKNNNNTSPADTTSSSHQLQHFSRIDEALMLQTTTTATATKRSLSSSSSSRSSSSSSDDDDENDSSNKLSDEEQVTGAFHDIFEKLSQRNAENKVIFTSRTHSQLAQMIDEVQKGPFRFERNNNPTVSSGNRNNNNQTDDYPLFGVRYLHIASRQQLCINDALREQASNPIFSTNNNSSSSGSERLNEMCKEACTEYKNNTNNANNQSKANRKKTASATTASKSVASLLLEEKKKIQSNNSAVDIEDLSSTTNSKNKVCGCEYSDPQRIELLLRHMMIAPRSLQELKELGQTLKACPYFATKYAIPFSQLLLMPYTYLVDEKMRKQMLDTEGLGGGMVFSEKMKRKEKFSKNNNNNNNNEKTDNKSNKYKNKNSSSSFFQLSSTKDSETLLKNSIVVIDEAHNLAEAATAASTASIRLASINAAIQTIELYLKKYEARFLISTKTRLRELIVVLDGWKKHMVHQNSSMMINSGTSSQNQNQQQVLLNTQSLTQFTFDTDTAHVNYFALLEFLETSDAINRIGWFGEKEIFLKQQQQQQQQQPQQSQQIQQPSPVVASPIKSMREIHRICELIARSPEKGTVVAVIREEGSNMNNNNNTQNNPMVMITLQILGLSPAQAVESVTTKAKTTILAGGTLQPFQLMKMELFPSYPSKFGTARQFLDSSTSNNHHHYTDHQVSKEEQEGALPPLIVETFGHVVNPNRFMLFPVSNISQNNNSVLRFTKANLDDPNIKHQLLRGICSTVLQLSRVVPRGLVVFFPSFGLEEALFEVLSKQEIQTKNQIEMNKKIFREDRSSSPFLSSQHHQNQNQTKKKTQQQQSSSNNNNNESLFDSYSDHIHKMKKDFPNLPEKGAVLFSVMGGKLSEGINFVDDLGRCVVVVGLPYPNLGDPKLQLKLESLKQSSAKTAESTTSASNNNNQQQQQDWSKKYYDALCMRSVNQSIGRCIRHIRDYSVVVLLDERYGDARIAKQLPKWMYPRIQFGNETMKSGCVRNFEQDVMGEMKKFFEGMQRE